MCSYSISPLAKSEHIEKSRRPFGCSNCSAQCLRIDLLFSRLWAHISRARDVEAMCWSERIFLECPQCGEKRIDNRCHYVRFVGATIQECYRRDPKNRMDDWVTEEYLFCYLSIFSSNPPAAADTLSKHEVRRAHMVQHQKLIQDEEDNTTDFEEDFEADCEFEEKADLISRARASYCRRWPDCGTYTAAIAERNALREMEEAIPSIQSGHLKWKSMLEAWRENFDESGNHRDAVYRGEELKSKVRAPAEASSTSATTRTNGNKGGRRAGQP